MIERAQELIGSGAAARIAGVSRQTIANWVRRGALVPRTPGPPWRFMAADVIAAAGGIVQPVASNDPDSDIITAGEACRLVGVKCAVIKQWLRQGRISEALPLAEDGIIRLKRQDVIRCAAAPPQPAPAGKLAAPARRLPRIPEQDATRSGAGPSVDLRDDPGISWDWFTPPAPDLPDATG